MALNTEISWCDHTLNLWWGCFKVSPGCKHCYADTLDNRYNNGNRSWGQNAGRKLVRSWKKNLNEMRKSAISHNRRETVFVMSMGDIFEDEKLLTNNFDTNWLTTNDVRQEFLSMIPQYPELIFLLLTKRPENIAGVVPMYWLEYAPDNVWFGTSIVNQEEVIPRLKALYAMADTKRLFVSMEPLLGATTLSTNLGICDFLGEENGVLGIQVPNWIIVGGESGQKARPMNPAWVRSLRDEADAAGIPFHFKQWGENFPIEGTQVMAEAISGEPIVVKSLVFEKRGKHNSGNVLDGKVLQAFPSEFHTPIKAEVTV